MVFSCRFVIFTYTAAEVKLLFQFCGFFLQIYIIFILFFFPLEEFVVVFQLIDNDGDTALVLTNHEAPMFKLIRVNMSTANKGPAAWETVIPENEQNKLEWVTNVGGDRLVVSYIEDVKVSTTFMAVVFGTFPLCVSYCEPTVLNSRDHRRLFISRSI